MRAAAVHISGCGSFLSLCPCLPWGPEAAVVGKAGSFWDHRYSQGSRGLGWSYSCLLLSIGHRAGAPSSPEAGDPPPSSYLSRSTQLQSLEQPLNTKPVASELKYELPAQPPTLSYPRLPGPDLVCLCLCLPACPSLVRHLCLNLTSAMVPLSPLISFCLSSLSICNSASDFPEGAG